MDKRALIGIALSILVLVVYQQLVTHFYGPPPSAPIPETETSQAEKAVPAAPSAAAPSTVSYNALKCWAGGPPPPRAVSRIAGCYPGNAFSGQIGQRNYGRNGSLHRRIYDPGGAAQEL